MNRSQSKYTFYNLTIYLIFFNNILYSYSSSSTSEMLYIRHGRSRVRHSNEKDHIRWGLKAFDNLTLDDYDITENYDNDTTMLFGSDLWASENNITTNYVNQTNIYGRNSKIIMKTTTNNNNNNNNNNNYDDGIVTTQIPSFSQPSSSSSSIIIIKKKLQKKKIMENIRKNVNKGLEYLKMHKNLQDDNYDRNLNSINRNIDNTVKNLINDNNDSNSKKSNLEIKDDNKKIQENSRLNEQILLKNNSDIKYFSNIWNTTTDMVSNTSEFDDARKNSINFSSSIPTERLLVAYYNKQQFVASESEINSPENIGYGNASTKVNNPMLDDVVRNSSTTKDELLLHDEPNQSENKSILKAVSKNGTIKHSNVDVSGKESPLNDVEISKEEQEVNFNPHYNTDELGNNNREDNENIRNNDNSGISENGDETNIEESGLEEQLEENDDEGRSDNDNDDEDGGSEGDETASFNVYGTTDEDLSDLDEISRNNRLNLMKGRDVVTKFLQIVESQHLLGANCTAGTALNLGEGVVDQYAQDRFRIEAEVAVNRANMLTRIFRFTSPEVQESEHLLHASVLSMVEFDDDIFAAGNCFDWNQHPVKKGLFCPFAYRLPPPDQSASFAKDLAAEYNYLGNTSEWFFLARKNAEKVISRNEQYIKAYHLYSNSTSREVDEILSVKYDDGRWSKPYYDCGGGNIWMLTYTVPFFGYENGTYFFKGTSGIDIDLRRVDIDQCPQRNTPGAIQPLNIFAGTDKCKQRTTMCEAITGLGFRRGSYKCICRRGFYYPDTAATQKYFNGSILEEEYEKLMLGEDSTYNKLLSYECLPCAEGCDSCEDASPCVAALNWPMRTSILVLACAVIGLLPPAAWFTFRYQQVKVVRAASPALLRVIALGAFFIYCTTIVMYPPPSLYTCTARIWLREIGFSLTYGALMLKTWRISVIFRVRSAKAVKITDAALLKRLGVICGVIGAFLLVRTIVSPPEVVVGRTADDLKAFLCKTDWWDYTFTSMEVLFLAWGVRLCIMVRKAPSEFNESRFISMAIYNEFLLTCFLNVSMLFLQSPANPDLLYIIFFCHTQLTVTLLLGLIFGSKVYIVLRSGKAQENAIGMGAKSSGAKFNFRPQIRTFANPSTATTSTAQLADAKLTDQEALEEIRQLSVQLQRIQELAPPKGIAVMTISSLLDGLKTTSHQISLRPPPAGSLPILALNNYQHQINKEQLSPVKTSDKSMNTSLLGEDFWREIERKCSNCQKLSGSSSSINFKRHQSHHNPESDTTTAVLICAASTSSTDRHKYCDKQTSPTRYFKSGNLSFSDLELECMCSQSDDIDRCGDDDDNECCNISGCNNNNNNSYNKNNNNNNNNNNNYNKHKQHIRNSKISNRFNNRSLNKTSNDRYVLDDYDQTDKEEIGKDFEKSKKRKYHSSCSLVQSKSIHSSSCDNYKSNEHFLVCDKCKSKIVNNERIKIKLDSQKFKTISSPSTSSLILAEPIKTTSIPAAVSVHSFHKLRHEQAVHQKEQKPTFILCGKDDSDGDDDDVSFHSSSNDEYESHRHLRDHKLIVMPSTSASTAKNVIPSEIEESNALNIHSTCTSSEDGNKGGRVTFDKECTHQHNIEECGSSGCSIAGCENYGGNDNNTETESSGNDTLLNVAGSSGTNDKKGRNNRKSDKLVLDLNDRSKYTKEVSV